ncbi:hypothetical protein [Kribbella kalugense]|uniref:Uncharacterized protein n=1 Tax=Kribbella kalugense TaxID=2512221 RepID=A0A4R7ZLY8_9ACTN|nr:hypothetical protein [Kribbella kalugense]TDW18425.1 hypothetical protein EV650_5012 [Kribbella kalugense]
MSNSTPEIPGYQLDQRLLEHPLAELWHGRTFTGMEIIALVLSEDGVRDQTVVDRLAEASRATALVPGQQEAPLWAANFNSSRPYAITQLIPGQTGAERLIDPLDGIIGNDDASLRAIREQLSGYGAMPPTLPIAADIPSYVDHPQQPPQATTEQPQSKIDVARQYSRKIGGWVYAVIAIVVLIVFSIAYSIGSAIGSAVKDDPTDANGPAAPAVSPEPIPSAVLIPPVNRVTTAPYKRPDGSPGIFGAAYPAGADVQVVANAELPFAVGWPRPPQVDFLGESSQLILRRIVTATEYDPGGLKNAFKAQFALHPCVSLAQCLSDRPTFDQQWTKIYETTTPATAKDARTWLTVSPKAPYTITMTHAFLSGGQWWLVGAMVYGQPVEAPDIQRVVNDIWRQTS